jgi:hypothetical protein
MRNGRITKQQAQKVWAEVCSAVDRSPKLRGGMVMPQIDIDAIFGDRKSMTVANVVGEISRCVAMVND